MTVFIAYVGLFASAFVAATLLPAQSEAVLVILLSDGSMSAPLLVFVASVGNTLGSAVNYWLGRWIETYKNYRWFPVSEASLSRAAMSYRRFGRWSLLLSWMPFIGDPITVVAGVMRERFSLFLLIVFIAKTARYVVLAAVTLNWFA